MRSRLRRRAAHGPCASSPLSPPTSPSCDSPPAAWPTTFLSSPDRNDRPWSDYAWRNWRKRVFTPAAQAAGLRNVRPYDLRHSFISLLLAEGASIVELAQQAGHAPTMTLDTYGHVVEELAGRERRSAEQGIREARDELVPLAYPRRRTAVTGSTTESAEMQEIAGEPTRGLEPRTPSLRVLSSPPENPSGTALHTVRRRA